MLNSSLVQKHCVPCEGGTKPLTRAEFAIYLEDLKDWQVINDEKVIEKEITRKNFKEVIALVNKIADLANEEGHHPDLFIHDFKNLKISLWTHAIGGLSINDFVMAAKIDQLLKN